MPMSKFRIIIIVADYFRISLLFIVYMYSLLSIWLRMVALTENITNKIYIMIIMNNLDVIKILLLSIFIITIIFLLF